MYTVTDVRRVGGPNCDTDHFLVRVRWMDKIMKMQERYSKRNEMEERRKGGRCYCKLKERNGRETKGWKMLL
jgi:hypothetical protein